MKLETNKWKGFSVNDLFIVQKSRNYTQEEIEDSIGGTIPYITRTENDNGVKDFVNNEDNLFKLEEGNCITIGGESALAFYQPINFISGNNISKLYLRERVLTENIALFISTLLNKERYRYGYGRAFNIKNISNTVLLLPVDQSDNPDWEWIENYIKSLKEREKERLVHILNHM